MSQPRKCDADDRKIGPKCRGYQVCGGYSGISLLSVAGQRWGRSGSDGRKGGAMEEIEYMDDKWPDDWFAQFWAAYPRRVAKKDAFRALDRVRRNNEVEFGRLISAVREFARSVRGKDPQYVCHPSTYVNGGRWDDEISQGVDETSWKLDRAMQETRQRRLQ